MNAAGLAAEVAGFLRFGWRFKDGLMMILRYGLLQDIPFGGASALCQKQIVLQGNGIADHYKLTTTLIITSPRLSMEDLVGFLQQLLLLPFPQFFAVFPSLYSESL